MESLYERIDLHGFILASAVGMFINPAYIIFFHLLFIVKDKRIVLPFE